MDFNLETLSAADPAVRANKHLTDIITVMVGVRTNKRLTDIIKVMVGVTANKRLTVIIKVMVGRWVAQWVSDLAKWVEGQCLTVEVVLHQWVVSVAGPVWCLVLDARDIGSGSVCSHGMNASMLVLSTAQDV